MMGPHTFEHANAMPAPTWHRMGLNDVEITIPTGFRSADAEMIVLDAPASLICEDAGVFDDALARYQNRRSAGALERAKADDRAVLKALDAATDPHDLDIPALSAYERQAVADERSDSVVEAFACGLGQEATGFLASMAVKKATLVASADEKTQARVHVIGQEGCCSVAQLDVVAKPHSELSLVVSLDSPASGSGLAAVSLRVFAGLGSKVSIDSVHTLDDPWIALDNTGLVLEDGARVRVGHRMMGAGKSYTGLAADLRGVGSRIDIDTRYYAGGEDLRDFNYVVKHRGQKTISNINANGVLAGTSKKTLRGTIDLVHGCKGSEGAERETVLLVDEGVDNKTIPVILCDEDDVAGNHGATIGHVRPEQLFYLGCRGLSPEAAEGLFVNAMLEETALSVQDEQVFSGVSRLAAKRGVALFEEGEE